MPQVIDFVLFTDPEGRPTRLTNQASRSRNGLPALVVDAMGIKGAFGPRKQLGVRPAGMTYAPEPPPDWYAVVQTAPESEFDQRIAR